MHGSERWLFLVFTSLTFFTSEFVVDEISLLNARLQGTVEPCRTGEDPSCLHLSSAQFNGLFVGHFWAGGICAICTGFFVGKFGIWIASLVSAFLLLVGMIVITVAPYCTTNAASFGLLVAGRIIYSCGYYANITLSHEVKSLWFFGKELALAFTIHIASGHLGSVVTFASIGGIVEKYHLQNTMWIVFGVAMVGPISTIAAAWIYKKYSSVTLETLASPFGKGKFSLTKVKHLGRDFWILFAITFLYFGALFTILADGPKYLKEVYQYPESTAGILIGIINDISLFAPLFGFLIDKFGGRDLYTIAGLTFILIVCTVSAALPNFFVGLTTSFVGLSYAIISASLWSSIPIVTTADVVGVAMGVTLGVQAFGSGLLLLVTGFLLDNTALAIEERWKRFFIFLTAFSAVGWILAALSMYFDNKSGGKRLRKRHCLPAMAADMNEFIGEIMPLISENKSVGVLTDSFSNRRYMERDVG